MKRNAIMEEIRSTEEYYIQAVKDKLTCNNDEFCSFYNFDYSDEDIDNNAKYFVDCMKRGLSHYKALLFFYDYLQENKVDK